MPVTISCFRKLALTLPGAMESSHMGQPDFRASGRIFATLSAQARGRGVLKLTLEQQQSFVAELPGVFEPVPGGWGRMGMTDLLLDAADEALTQGALSTAHRNVTSKPARPATGRSEKKSAAAAKPRRRKP